MDKRTDDISRQLRVFITTFQADVRRLAKASERDQQLAAALEPAEAAHIRRALSACGGNKSQAARLLQIDRRSLQRKLVRLTSPKAKKKPAAKKPAKRRR